MSDDGERPCGTCPWLRANQTLANARSGPRGADGVPWYSLGNLRRLWGGIRTGNGMLCHATDPHAPNYGGKPHEPGHERICVGAVALAAKHIRRLEAIPRGTPKPLKVYAESAPHRPPFTRRGLAAWVERAMFPPGLPRIDETADVGLPWEGGGHAAR